MCLWQDKTIWVSSFASTRCSMSMSMLSLICRCRCDKCPLCTPLATVTLCSNRAMMWRCSSLLFILIRWLLFVGFSGPQRDRFFNDCCTMHMISHTARMLLNHARTIPNQLDNIMFDIGVTQTIHFSRLRYLLTQFTSCWPTNALLAKNSLNIQSNWLNSNNFTRKKDKWRNWHWFPINDWSSKITIVCCYFRKHNCLRKLLFEIRFCLFEFVLGHLFFRCN